MAESHVISANVTYTMSCTMIPLPTHSHRNCRKDGQCLFSKLFYNKKDREKWENAFTFDFVSSEESECSDADVILVRSVSMATNKTGRILIFPSTGLL